jgi:riboflavin biosynthesis pyrimidine reductase
VVLWLTAGVRVIYPAGSRRGAIAVAPRPEPASLAAARVLARRYAYPDGRGGGGRPWLRANMICSADGAATLGGHSGGLSSPADRMVFAVLRTLADVILVGAGTARTEGYKPVQPAELWQALRRGRPPVPPIAVLSRALDLDLGAPLITEAPDEARTILLTTEAAPERRREAASRHARVIVAGRQLVDPAAAITALAALGHTRILTEGGPSVLGQLAAAGLLDELCLTISPVLAGGKAIRITDTAAELPGAKLELAGVLTDDGQLLCRYVRGASAERAAPGQ